MAEECADCGASFGSPAELVVHMKKAHAGGDSKASMDMNPESHIAGLECAACGARFATREELASHNLRPHATTQGTKSRAAAFT
ncbi:MAG: C2H2-type zinc finger protein [Thermoplasmata archaeon]